MTTLPGAVLFSRIEALSVGLRFDDLGSEGDQPVAAWRSDGVVDGALDEASFAAAAGIDGAAIKQFEPGAASLERLVEVMSLSVFGEEPGPRTRTLVELMKEHLRDIVVVVGTGDGDRTGAFPTWLAGVADDGHLVGLSSAVIWT